MTTSIRGAGGKIIIISTMWNDPDKEKKDEEDREDEDYGDLGYGKHKKFEKSSKLVKNLISIGSDADANSRFVFKNIFYIKTLLIHSMFCIVTNFNFSITIYS